ncbi:hypothetical protein B0813_002204 [Candidatus Fervidibacteria bacterium JGI MDM2 SSWTFF-3-K9]
MLKNSEGRTYLRRTSATGSGQRIMVKNCRLCDCCALRLLSFMFPTPLKHYALVNKVFGYILAGLFFVKPPTGAF